MKTLEKLQRLYKILEVITQVRTTAKDEDEKNFLTRCLEEVNEMIADVRTELRNEMNKLK